MNSLNMDDLTAGFTQQDAKKNNENQTRTIPNNFDISSEANEGGLDVSNMQIPSDTTELASKLKPTEVKDLQSSVPLSDPTVEDERKESPNEVSIVETVSTANGCPVPAIKSAPVPATAAVEEKLGEVVSEEFSTENTTTLKMVNEEGEVEESKDVMKKVENVKSKEKEMTITTTTSTQEAVKVEEKKEVEAVSSSMSTSNVVLTTSASSPSITKTTTSTTNPVLLSSKSASASSTVSESKKDNNKKKTSPQKAKKNDKKTKPVVRSKSVVVPPTYPLGSPLLAGTSMSSSNFDAFLFDPNYVPITDEPGEFLHLQKCSHGVKKKENKQGIKYESRIRYQYGATSADSSIAYLGNYQCPITAARTYDMAKVIMKGLYVVKEKAARSLNFEYDFLVMKGNKGRILYMRTKPLHPEVTPVKIYRVASSINWLHGRDNHIWKLKEKEENHQILYQYCDVIKWDEVEEALIELGEGNSSTGGLNTTTDNNKISAEEAAILPTTGTTTTTISSVGESSSTSGNNEKKDINAEGLQNDGNFPISTFPAAVTTADTISSSFSSSANNIGADVKSFGPSIEDLSKFGQQLGYDLNQEVHGMVGVDSTGKNVERRKLERLNNRKKKLSQSMTKMIPMEDDFRNGIQQNNIVAQKSNKKKERKRKAGECMGSSQDYQFQEGEGAGHSCSTAFGDDQLSFDDILKATHFNNISTTTNNKNKSKTATKNDGSEKRKKKRVRKNTAAVDTSLYASSIDQHNPYNFGAACFSLPSLDTSAYNLDINFTANPFQGCTPYQSNLMLVTNALATVASSHHMHTEGSGKEGHMSMSPNDMMNISLRDLIAISTNEGEASSETTNKKSENIRQGHQKSQNDESNDALNALYGDSISATDYL